MIEPEPPHSGDYAVAHGFAQRYGALEPDPVRRGYLAYACTCGWRVCFPGTSDRPNPWIIEANNIAIDHVLGRRDDPATTGFLPQPLVLGPGYDWNPK